MITLPLAPQDPNDVEGTSPSVDFVAVPWWRIDGVRPCIYSRDHCIVAFAGGEVRVKHPAAHVCALVDAAALKMMRAAAPSSSMLLGTIAESIERAYARRPL